MTENFFHIDDLTQGLNRELAEGITTRIFPGDQAMLSVVRLEANARGKLHCHPEEQWGFMIQGSATRIQDGQHIQVRKGAFWRTPGHVEHSVIAGPEGCVILDVFAPPREEYKNPGSGFGTKTHEPVSTG